MELPPCSIVPDTTLLDIVDRGNETTTRKKKNTRSTTLRLLLSYFRWCPNKEGFEDEVEVWGWGGVERGTRGNKGRLRRIVWFGSGMGQCVCDFRISLSVSLPLSCLVTHPWAGNENNKTLSA